jgi:ribosome biogenesis GTPase / thiamine phosphate phosphatase
MQDRLESGLVVRVTGGDVWVRVGSEVVVCVLRGRWRVKKESSPVVAGDRVAVRRMPDGAAALEEVLPRSSVLSRWVARVGGARLIVANVDILFAVASVAEPALRPAFIDRVLAAAAWGRAPAAIVLNKIDLAQSSEVDTFVGLYESCGYDVLPTCAMSGRGMDAVAGRIASGVYAFVGESGVGKSSLLNGLEPNLERVTRDVAERSRRGRHTTSSSELVPFRGGLLADTPGMQTFEFPGSDETELAACFPDIERINAPCRFQPCTHSHEPACAVKAAVEAGHIKASRYESYAAILEEIRTRKKAQSW